MSVSWVTLQGWVGGEVTCRDAGGVPVATFRLGCTPRFLKEGEWVNGQTSWYTVTCWRGLAHNVTSSVHKGQPVVVHGRIRADVWEREGQPPAVSQVVEAVFVGHDLSKGVSTFQRPGRTDSGPAPVVAAPPRVPEQRQAEESAA